MAQQTPHLVHTVAAPQHYAPPTPREMRAQAVHRLQVGFSGLAAMLLLVGLANIIMNRARMNDAMMTPGSVASQAVEKSASETDPLADIGVAPAATGSGNANGDGAPR
jgi:hypothetical protein